MTPPPVAPGPSMLAALRNLATVGGSLARVPGFLEAVSRRYGPVASWRMPRGRFWFVDDPPLIDALLTANGSDVVKSRGTRRMARLLGQGLLTSEEPLHLRQRRLVQPAFHRERVAGYATTMIAVARQAADGLADGQAIDAGALMNRIALRIAAATLFSAEVDDAADAIGRALTDVLAAFPASIAAYGELLDHLPWHPATRRFAAARAALDAVVYRLIEERRRDRADRGDLLSILLGARDEDGTPMPDEQVRDEALTLLLAGHETTANALAWAWDFLGRHPEAEAALHRELDAVLGERDPFAADVPSLRVARDVVAETLRLRPPAWILGRRIARGFRLGPWELAPGTVVLISPLVTHRNPRCWREPDAFRPERWSNGETAALPRGAYFPFGGGSRICIGEGFAWTEAVLVLALLARRFRLRPLDTAPPPPEPLVTLRPGRGVRMRVETRRAVTRV
ncbi:MAG TPA: cytochrome P450 [Candidatus Baltobacteraceae bacterium]|nr:cytochrome P450 [Candidatus Baltobacteraceae bacterium]